MKNELQKNNNPKQSAVPLEISHNEFPIEWWFFNGEFQIERHGKFSFMISFFRHNEGGKSQSGKSGYSLLFSLLNNSTGNTTTRSQIDSVVLSDMIKILDEKKSSDLDGDLINVLLQELLVHGPPNPIKVKDLEFEENENYLKIKWEDFELIQDSEKFQLEFITETLNDKISIQLKPSSNAHDLLDQQTEKFLGGKMIYRCYPRMEISGSVGRDRISGIAWMDHQWGDTSWYITEEEKRQVLGWDWFGINFEDGSDLLILIHKYARTNEPILSNAVLMQSGKADRVSNEFTAAPLEFWESPNTHIKYPIKWRIEIPEFNCSFIFSPLKKDQEIPAFGLARAIWEGAGLVEGNKEGKAIAGRARGEFFGYGYIFDFQLYLTTLADRFDKRIEEYFPKIITNNIIEKFVGKPVWKHEPEAYTKMLSVPIWDLILRRGKRWRPIFGILMLEALGVPAENYEKSFCLAELVHSGALIIDDIQDNSLLRRGEKALHLKYGIDTAINAGNTLYFLPYTELLNHKFLSDSQKLKIHQIWMNTYLQAHFGQTADIYWSNNISQRNLSDWLEDSFEEKILQMYDYKTAAGAKGLAKVAAVIAEQEETISETVSKFARAFAVAFQIVDDVHNFSRSDKWTKVTGEDLINGKLTFVIVKAIKMLDTEKSIKLKSILCSEELRKNKDEIEKGIDLVKESGALEVCKNTAREMSLREWKNFANIIPSNEAKIMLNMLTLKMLDLAYDT